MEKWHVYIYGMARPYDNVTGDETLLTGIQWEKLSITDNVQVPRGKSSLTEILV